MFICENITLMYDANLYKKAWMSPLFLYFRFVKPIIVLLLVLIVCRSVNGQAPPPDTANCWYHPISYVPFIGTIYGICDTSPPPNFNVVIEPTPGNIWHKGKTNKFGNADIRDTSCAIFTDTANEYPVNNYAAFHFLLPATPQGFFSYYIKFWHKYETDSLLDGCWLEFSTDSGTNWYPADSFFSYNNLSNIYSYCNLYSVDGKYGDGNFDSLQNGRLAWSGSSNGWQYTALHLNFSMPFKPTRATSINAVRFVFQSDSINNSKPGWIINNFATGWVDIFIWGATNDFNARNQLPIYPNPSSSGVFNISYPATYVKGTIEVYNFIGQKIFEQSLSTRLDLSRFNNGIYFYRSYFDGKVYSGVLSKN